MEGHNDPDSLSLLSAGDLVSMFIAITLQFAMQQYWAAKA